MLNRISSSFLNARQNTIKAINDELLKINNDIERKFYENQNIIENWSIRELRRQKKTGLFQRIALSKDKSKILKLSKKGYQPTNENDIIKQPYIFEFLGIPEGNLYSENELEKKLIDKSDNETIGIVLTSEKDDVFVKYTTASISNELVVSEYQLYLPDKKY